MNIVDVISFTCMLLSVALSRVGGFLRGLKMAPLSDVDSVRTEDFAERFRNSFFPTSTGIYTI